MTLSHILADKDNIKIQDNRQSIIITAKITLSAGTEHNVSACMRAKQSE